MTRQGGRLRAPPFPRATRYAGARLRPDEVASRNESSPPRRVRATRPSPSLGLPVAKPHFTRAPSQERQPRPCRLRSPKWIPAGKNGWTVSVRTDREVLGGTQRAPQRQGAVGGAPGLRAAEGIEGFVGWVLGARKSAETAE